MKVIELNITNKIIQLPNIITLLRIAGSLGLLLCDVTDVAFWIIYALCGISDIADGWLARKMKCVAKKGALLDSLADICFVACCAWKLLPILDLPQWLWLWAGVIVAIKIVNQLSALVMYGCCCFPHTLANKWAGFLLFITVPMTLWSIAPISIATIVATFAAIHEGHYIRMNKIKMKERFKFNTVGLFTRDNKATVDFYTKTFGFTTDWDGIQPNVEMMLGNMRIILYPRSDFEQMVSYKFQYSMGLNGTAELAFDVPSYADVDKEYQHALANGAGGPTELHTHEHNHLFIVTEGAKFVDYLKKKEIKTNFLIAFTVKTKRDIISLTMGQRNYTAATFSHILLRLLANLQKTSYICPQIVKISNGRTERYKMDSAIC